MKFDPFQVSIPHIVYAALGGFVVLFGMFSLFIREKLYVGEAIWAFLFGVVIGPYGANIFDPRGWGGGERETINTITLEVTRVILAIGVFAIGVELPKAYMQRHWKSLLFLLGPVMTWGWFVSGALIYALIPSLNFLSSLAVAACLTPTDPILAAAVVGGKYADKHVPAHLRHLLAAESGCNDGAAFPFLFLALYLIVDPTTGRAVSDWILLLWLYQVVLGIVFGALLGWGFRHLMRFCESKDLIDRQSYVAQYVSLAMLTIGATTLLGSDDLLAAFSCGAAFAWDGFFNKQTEEAVFSSVIDLLFNIAAFVFVGAWMPFNEFTNATLGLSLWRLFVVAILVLILRRLPVIIALYKFIPDIKTFREAIFSGHFGPMGIGAVFISTLAAEQLPVPENPPVGQQQMLAASIQPIVAFMVLCSIAVHGLSIPFFTFGRRVHSVSRTWSRHDTMGSTRRRSILPEWATQIRHVQPGEAIIINRDRQAESLTPIEGSSTQEEKPVDEEPQTPREKVTPPGSEQPPDGSGVVAEWREGPHRVIERREGPGAEVEVEVQRNAYGPSETRTHTLRVAEAASRHVVEDIRSKLRHAPHELEQMFHVAEEGVKHEVKDIEEWTKAVLHAQSPQISPTTSQREGAGGGQPRDAGDESPEDEGWMSDHSAGEPSGNGVQGKDKSRKAKAPQSKVPKAKSKRTFMRRGILGHRPHTLQRSQSEDFSTRRHSQFAAGDEARPQSGAQTPSEETRGRSSAMRSPRSPRTPVSGAATPVGPNPHLRLAHRRIDSIRSELPSREMSPARSVRFADDGRGGTSTPRIVSPTTPAAEGENVEEDDDSPKSTVRFSLPGPEAKQA
ncbi:Sodium/hydrogen exchanger family-domain-containing protein [Ganoderma leucocontextum]|nr:Sodium/hydrogen exchanger family-domain-containing protein [Ganoderma leucocontextum]